jgi:hypothetical protein
VTPQLQAVTGINYFDLGFEDARCAAGITRAMVMPGSKCQINGRAGRFPENTGFQTCRNDLQEKPLGIEMRRW